MKQPISLREGMIVHSADGTKLGKVVSCRSDGFIIEKGVFLPKSTQFQYDDVSELRGDDVYLAHGQAQLTDTNWWAKREQAKASLNARGIGENRTKANPTAERTTPAIELAARPYGQTAPVAANDPDEIRVPLAEEEVMAEKRTRDAGEVIVHKRIVVTQKQITIPLMHEEVRIERVPVEEKLTSPITEGMFVESTVTIPLHGEEVELCKRAVVREEVRVKRFTRQEEKTTTTDVRKEEIDIEEPKGFSAQLHPPTP